MAVPLRVCSLSRKSPRIGYDNLCVLQNWTAPSHSERTNHDYNSSFLCDNAKADDKPRLSQEASPSGFTMSLSLNVVVKFFCLTNHALINSHS